MKLFIELKEKCETIGIPISGTIQMSYRACGKKGCRCREAKEFRHGPYYVWYRRENGKLITQSLNPDELQDYKQCIENREKMEKTLKSMLDAGTQHMKFRKNAKLNSKK